MAVQVVFHQLAVKFDFNEDEFVEIACKFIADNFTAKNYISVLCAQQKEAEMLDESLWQLPVERFIPHNLIGEGDGKAAPVEILYYQDSQSTQPQIRNKQCLINFSQQLLEVPAKFGVIHEFVPSDEEGKAKARLRYADYKKAGCALQFIK